MNHKWSLVTECSVSSTNTTSIMFQVLRYIFSLYMMLKGLYVIVIYNWSELYTNHSNELFIPALFCQVTTIIRGGTSIFKVVGLRYSKKFVICHAHFWSLKDIKLIGSIYTQYY